MQRVVTAVVATLVLLLAWVGVRSLQAQDDLGQVREALAEARAEVAAGRFTEARAAVQEAVEPAERARSRTSDPAFRLLSAVPVAGRTLDTTAVVAEGVDLLVAGALLPALEAVSAVDLEALQLPDGRLATAPLVDLVPSLRAAEQQGERVSDLLAGASSGAVLPAVAEGRAALEAEAERLVTATRGAAAVAGVLPALLGEDRPRRYFVMVQQTAESRGTGGVLGGYAVLELRQGRVTVLRQGSNADLEPRLLEQPVEPGPDLPEDFIARYAPLGAFATWVNVNLSPDLPAVAQLVEQRWTSQGGAALDGVLTLDPRALSYLLADSGDLPNGQGGSFPAERVEDFLAVGQYEGVAPTPDQSARKERLEVVAAAAVARLSRPQAGDGLLRGILRSVADGRLRLASDDPVLAPALAEAGVDGALPSGPAPVAYPVVFNSTGGKLDTWLGRSLRYDAGECTGERRRSTITLRLVSEPPEGLPPYVTVRADAPDGQSRINQVHASVFATAGSRLVRATLDGRTLSVDGTRGPAELQPAEEAGLPVWGLLVDLPPGEPRELVLELDEPVVPGAPRTPEQPLTRPLELDVEVPAC